MDFTEYLGMKTVSAEEGRCRIELELNDTHLSTAARAHGGVLFTLLDTALGRALISLLPEGRGCATVECKINYFRPIVKGRIVGEARVVTRTRRTAYTEGEITDTEGRLLAKATGTFFITETREQAERERV